MKKREEISSVKLKGVGDGISVSLDPSQPIETLQSDLKTAFERLRHVACNAKVILEPGGEEDHKELIDTLASFLKKNFGVGSVTGPARKRDVSEEQVRQQDVFQSWRNRRSEALILSGRVRSGQHVTARKHLVLLGDVNPGGEVIAGGDILILGSLCGTAAAGQPDRQEAIVLALDFRPMQVQIAGVIETNFSSTAGFGQAEFARAKGGSIVIENYLKAGPFKRLSWPEVR
ncbi:MAG: septum site-determining protein MinC [Deltaproteobacteria bacterium HGW-Deltaproteobacteria-15]|jgi:septum site-determining protein MinC|nr:MAG: septum site-determining protein MinC [Deltaproteobacteria bacterium HGW-Deltaproteobacteria-15]